MIREIEQEIDCAARSDAKVLLTGESGVGKEVVARLIHQNSRRRATLFAAINCAGIPDSLLESELFGHIRGSFTDAHRDKKGWFEQAQGGTVLLDEVGEMTSRMQATLLRFLETGEIQRVGSERVESRVDVRIVAATNRNLFEEIERKNFREDLYYRLNVIRIAIPPLRDRREDVPLLMNHFIRTFSESHRIAQPRLLDEALECLVAYPWPGNVRELKNIAERLVIQARSEVISPDDLPKDIFGTRTLPARPAEMTKSTAEVLFDRMTLGRESFWEVIYEPFMARDITRQDLRAVITRGLEQTGGDYKLLAQLFNIDVSEHKRVVAFLRKYDCHMPFHRFRAAPVRAEHISPGPPTLGKAV